MKANKVFVAGGLPVVTYIPRENLRLEEKLGEALDSGHKLISITGPTKSGKTVLCKTLVTKDRVFLSGGQIRSEDEFWERVLSELNAEIKSTTVETNSESVDGAIEGSAGVNLKLFSMGIKASKKEGAILTNSSTTNHVVNKKQAAIKILMDNDMTLVIDDFHYLDMIVQRSIVRAIKDPIFDGLSVVVLAVPHRAYDAIKGENEMTGRVSQISIPLWSEKELTEIAKIGFEKLNVTCPEITILKLAKESFGSPHLMQEFCLRLCLLNNIKETVEGDSVTLKITNYDSFFKNIVEAISSKVAFEKLATGPRQRADRIPRLLNNGSSSDIYGCILHAIASTGPKTEISYEELRAALKGILDDQMPQAHQIKFVLGKMDEIAKKMEGEPVIDFEKDSGKLFISDPFFAFYLRWMNQV